MYKKSLIQIVDDIADYRELLAQILEQDGFQTISAKGGREAVELAIQYQPGLVLMDLNMPGMNGYEATRAIHAHLHGRKIPIVAVSADCAACGFELCAIELGFIAFLAKPFEPESLLKIVHKVLKTDIKGRRAA
jgi:CheY-like chemotaxis protein